MPAYVLEQTETVLCEHCGSLRNPSNFQGTNAAFPIMNSGVDLDHPILSVTAIRVEADLVVKRLKASVQPSVMAGDHPVRTR